MKTGAHLNQVPTRTDWATPWPLFLQYDAEFHFTLDVCATRENAKCAEFIPARVEWTGAELGPSCLLDESSIREGDRRVDAKGLDLIHLRRNRRLSRSYALLHEMVARLRDEGRDQIHQRARQV